MAKVTIELSPSSAKLEYDRGIELEFTADVSDVLNFFDAKEIVENVDCDDLLEAIGEDAVREWLSHAE